MNLRPSPEIAITAQTIRQFIPIGARQVAVLPSPNRFPFAAGCIEHGYTCELMAFPNVCVESAVGKKGNWLPRFIQGVDKIPLAPDISAVIQLDPFLFER